MPVVLETVFIQSTIHDSLEKSTQLQLTALAPVGTALTRVVSTGIVAITSLGEHQLTMLQFQTDQGPGQALPPAVGLQVSGAKTNLHL